MGIARYLVDDQPGFFPGVPLRDLTDEEFDSYPDWVQRSIDASELYRKTPIRARRTSQETTDKEAEQADSQSNEHA